MLRGRMVGVLATVIALSTSSCAWVVRHSSAARDGAPAGDQLGAFTRPAVSTDGRFVAYLAHADTNFPGASDLIIRHDYATQEFVRIDVASDETPANDTSREPAISGDGRYVAFTSDADNLDPAGLEADDNFSSDIFVRDVVAGTTERVSVATDGTESDLDNYAPSISSDGRYVAFTSDSDELDLDNDFNGSSDIYVHDRQTHTTTLVSVWTDGTPTDFGAWDGLISSDGKHVAFSTDTDWGTGDNNESEDVYMRDLAPANKTQRVSALSPGGGLPAISRTGQYVAFISVSGDVYVRDTIAKTSKRANLNTTAIDLDYPAISGDGRWVAWVSDGNATGSDTNGAKADVFLRDMVNSVSTVGSTRRDLVQINHNSYGPAISDDGHYVAWYSDGDFDDADSNDLNDIWMRAIAVPKIVSVSPPTIQQGTSTTITVTGKGFIAPNFATVGVATFGVDVTSSQWVSDTQVKLNVTVHADATLGPQSIEIVNNGTGLGMFGAGVDECIDCITVTP